MTIRDDLKGHSRPSARHNHQPKPEPDPRPFCPSQMLWARHRRGLTQANVAEAVGTSILAIKEYESGVYEPTPERRRLLAQKLEVPIGFFHADDERPVVLELMGFTAPSMITADQKKRALGSAAFAVMLDRWIWSLFALPALAIPASVSGQEPELAAQALRRSWKLGREPVADVITLLDRQGIRIFSIPADIAGIGTFSFWSDARPYVFLPAGPLSCHVNVEAARRLGSLVLCRDEHATGPSHKALDHFASAFLLPKNGLAIAKSALLDADSVVATALKWHVPPALLLVRLRELGSLSEWKYRTLQVAVAKRSSHPERCPSIAPPFLASIFSLLCSKGLTKRGLAIDAKLHFKDVDDLTFGAASHAFNRSDEVTLAESQKPALRIVRSEHP